MNPIIQLILGFFIGWIIAIIVLLLLIHFSEKSIIPSIIQYSDICEKCKINKAQYGCLCYDCCVDEFGLIG